MYAAKKRTGLALLKSANARPVPHTEISISLLCTGSYRAVTEDTISIPG
jgi:hypothetical protein